VPLIVLASLVALVLLIAVVRAAASARGDERGMICFLSKLGVQIGGGCSSSSSRLPAAAAAAASKSAVSKALGELVEHTPRVKDIEPSAGSGSILTMGGAGAAATTGDGGSKSSGGGGGARLRRLASNHPL
jgi:hypothetical protein